MIRFRINDFLGPVLLCVAVGPISVSAVASPGLPQITFCQIPDPQVPSSAFEIFQSGSSGASGYWVRYECKHPCQDWRQCLVPAYTEDHGDLIPDGREPDSAKQAMAFVVDGLGGHIAVSNDGDKTVFIHTGAGGTRYYLRPADGLEKIELPWAGAELSF